jgi:hypothetical protein
MLAAMRRFGLLLVLVPLVIGTGACGGGDDDDGPTDSGATLSDDAVITYHYGDSSVPPEYHRSYTLTITKDEVHAVVDSYGDVLHDVTEPLPPKVWQQLVATVDTVLDLEVDEDAEPCAGGTTRDLKIEDKDEAAVDVGFGACGGSNGEAESAVDEWVQPVIDAIPDWDSYLATE